MEKAYSALHVKEVRQDEDFVYITGVASTPTVDRVGDSVNPLGAKFETPLPLLLQHQHDAPVGEVTYAKPTKAGIPFEARLPIIREAGRLKDRVDEAIHSLKYKLLNFVSIGFSGNKDGVSRMEGGGLRFDSWNWLELSICTIPANPDAVISSVKSLRDEAPLTAEVLTALRSIDLEHLASAGRAGDRVAKPAARAVALTSTAKRGPVTIIKR